MQRLTHTKLNDTFIKPLGKKKEKKILKKILLRKNKKKSKISKLKIPII